MLNESHKEGGKGEQENIHLLINDLFENNNDTNFDVVKIENDKQSDKTKDFKDLDVSWIHEHEHLYNIKDNYLREPMEQINVFFLYINRNNYIEKIITDKLQLSIGEDEKYSYISKETLLQIIQTRKIKTSFSKYKLIDIVSFLVDLEPENIQSYSKKENLDNNKDFDLDNLPFFKVHSIMDDIRCNNSIFVFHGINAIYFLFEEVELINHRHTLRSILKPMVSSSEPCTDKTLTKKVRMQISNVENIKRHNSKNRLTRKVVRP